MKVYYLVSNGKAELVDEFAPKPDGDYGVDWIVVHASSRRDALAAGVAYNEGDIIRAYLIEALVLDEAGANEIFETPITMVT